MRHLLGNLWRRTCNRTFRRLQLPGAVAVPVILAGLPAMSVVVPAKNVAVLCPQGLLDEQPGCQLHERTAAFGRGQVAFDELS